MLNNNYLECSNLSLHEKGDLDKKLTELAEGSFFKKGINTKALKRKAA